MAPSQLLENFLAFARRVVPKSLFRLMQPAYHFTLACLSAIIYRFPSRHLKVIAVTGTKGKTTTVELINAIFEAAPRPGSGQAGWQTALSSTLRMKIADKSEPNLYKMTTPGRFFVQRFLRQAITAGCNVAILEMTSEAAKLYRHRFIDFDALVFTNIAPEHIESHGSFEKYLSAKLSIGEQLARSRKRPRIMVANLDDKHAQKFLDLPVDSKIGFSLLDARPYTLGEDGSELTFAGQKIKTSLPGLFNIKNILAAATLAKAFGISPEKIKLGIEEVRQIPGRVEEVRLPSINYSPRWSSGEAGELRTTNFRVIVDYAHTPDSLKALYEAFSDKKLICVLGSTGGGRDRWKRPKLGEIADQYCQHIILTNEDPYDEDPQEIIDQVAEGITNTAKMEKIFDRRLAIRHALELVGTLRLAPSNIEGLAQGSSNENNYVVLITGKGTDPYIMGPKGSKEPWSDKQVAEEELKKLI